MKYFVHIAYNGWQYHGWQRQLNARSVQQEIEEALANMFKTSISLSGCSRTDTLVHASQFFAHLKTDIELDEDHVFYINKQLPLDITVHNFIKVHRGAHAQKDVLLRSYDYFIHLYKDPLLFHASSYYDLKKLDFNKMNDACQIILENKDFRSLCKRPDLYKTTFCELREMKIFINNDTSRIRFRVSSNRFLQGMVRLMVGRLLQIGRGKLSLDSFSEILSSGQEIPSKLAAFPQGLYLSKVSYPYLDLMPENGFVDMLKRDLEEI